MLEPFVPVAVWVAVAVSGGAPPDGYHSEILPNGMQVSIVEDHAHPLVATQLWYHVGAADEDNRTRGLAHLFEHLMFGKTEAYPARAYADLHHRHGGYENAYTSLDETVYDSLIAPGPHQRVLEMEAARMRDLIFDQENLENEQKIVTEELRLRTENDPFSRLFFAAQKALLGNHPYAFDPSGSKEDIAAADLDTCRRFYDSFYRPDHAHLVVVGPVDRDQTLATIKREFGGIASGGRNPEDVPPLLGREYPDELTLEEDLPPVEVAIVGFPLPARDHEDDSALAVLMQLLAGGSVVPFEEILVQSREKAIAAGTEVLSFRRGGMLIFYSAHLPYRRRTTAFRHIDRTLEEIRKMEWLSDRSLAAAKRTIRLRAYLTDYTPTSRASSIGAAQRHLGDSALAFTTAERIEAVTRDDVAEAFARYLDGPPKFRLYVKPERVPLWVRLFGWLYPVVN